MSVNIFFFYLQILAVIPLHGFFGIGKAAVLKKFKTNTVLQQSAKVFDDESAAPEEIAVAGEKALVEMYTCVKKSAAGEA